MTKTKTARASQRYRPADRARSTPERILKAAADLFLSKGFHETNIDEIATAAAVTKPTIYSHFGSKDGLLLSMTEAYTANNAADLRQMLLPSGNTRSDLMRFGELFMERLLSDDAVGWHRLAMSESQKQPELGAAIFDAGPKAVLQSLTSYLQVESSSGRIQCDEPLIAAELLVGQLLGINPFRFITGQPLPSKQTRKKRVRMAIDSFMLSYGVE